LPDFKELHIVQFFFFGIWSVVLFFVIKFVDVICHGPEYLPNKKDSEPSFLFGV
jgi:hypothetical protein